MLKTAKLKILLSYSGFQIARALFRWLPWSVAYKIGTGLYYLAYYVLRLRRSYVHAALARAFPKKTAADIAAIAKRCYHYTGEFFVETLKGLSLNTEKLLTHWHIINPEILTPYFERGESITALMGHYGNWEFGVAAGKQMQHLFSIIYKPLHNAGIDKAILEYRSQHGALCINKYTFARRLLKRKKTPHLYLLLADQKPGGDNRKYRMRFLNQETDCLLAPGIISKKFKMPAIYFHVQRKKRGFYEVRLIPLPDPNDPEVTAKTIVAAGMKHLEAQIIEHPEYWLWLHRRWRNTTHTTQTDSI